MVRGLDPASRVLSERMAEIEADIHAMDFCILRGAKAEMLGEVPADWDAIAALFTPPRWREPPERALLKDVGRAVFRLFATARARRRLRGGDLLMAQGRTEEALERYREAVACAPWMGEVRNDLGVALMARGLGADAEREFLTASRCTPPSAHAHINLAQRYLYTGRQGAGREQLQIAAQLAPGNPRLALLLGYCALAFGDAEGGVRHYHEAWRAMPEDPDAASGYLLSLSYAESATPAALCAAHRQWAAALPDTEAGASPARDTRQPPWRIGYLSPDFRDHAVRFFLEPLLEHHDRRRFQVYCYSDARQPDSHTQRMRQRADHWCEAVGLADAELARTIRRDGVDVLVDLAGHTAGNRLAMLRSRLAPVQLTALGYPPTTGLGTIDWKLSDPVADPPGAELHYAEQLLRLPETFWCFAPPSDAPEVAASPAAANGFVTYGCMGNLAKIGDAALRAWSAILGADPSARLLLKCPTLDDEAVRAFTRERMGLAGIDPSRVEFEGRSDLAGFLGAYARIDIVLDTFPYNGGTTTCHALWMGVPVVSLAGEILLSRMGASMLASVGLDDLATRSWSQYADVAIALSRDREHLATLRRGLRERMRCSPLTDGARYTAALEDALERALR